MKRKRIDDPPFIDTRHSCILYYKSGLVKWNQILVKYKTNIKYRMCIGNARSSDIVISCLLHVSLTLSISRNNRDGRRFDPWVRPSW